jgi:hypothetical protein
MGLETSLYFIFLLLKFFFVKIIGMNLSAAEKPPLQVSNTPKKKNKLIKYSYNPKIKA